MKHFKEVFITGFALFSMFFGAGNLILPPFLGKNAGDLWSWVSIGFFMTAVLIPFLGILAHAKLQGTMYDFGKKISPVFSSIYCFIIYTISITLPAPRTAAVTHEMAIAPYFNINSLTTSSIYFFIVFLFTINRTKVLHLLGKFLTPLIIFILLAIISIGVLYPAQAINTTDLKNPFTYGLLEGYQTFDAIGAVVVGGILVISLNFNKNTSFQHKKNLIIKAGLIAGTALLIIYAGLIYNGAIFSSFFDNEATRTEVLTVLSKQTLGNIGTMFLSILVGLACFTTAVGIVTGTADYVKGITNNSKKAYVITAFLGCCLGVLIGQFNVKYIINIALPVLMFIYPITIVLIILNVLANKYTSGLVFKTVVIVTFIFSIPDFLSFFITNNGLSLIKNNIPLGNNNLGWVIPALISFALANIIKRKKLA